MSYLPLSPLNNKFQALTNQFHHSTTNPIIEQTTQESQLRRTVFERPYHKQLMCVWLHNQLTVKWGSVRPLVGKLILLSNQWYTWNKLRESKKCTRVLLGSTRTHAATVLAFMSTWLQCCQLQVLGKSHGSWSCYRKRTLNIAMGDPTVIMLD